MKPIVDCKEIDLIKVSEGREVFTNISLQKDNKDYEVFLEDILYTDGKSERILLSYAEQHEMCSSELLHDSQVFWKKYEWSYEKECRLVIEPSASGKKKLEEVKKQLDPEKKEYLLLRLYTPEYRKMKTDGLIKSPIYKGGVFFGKDSSLLDEIIWDI